ncbi:MAG: asparagine synthase (glutamine-hydrolyzing) [Bacteroidetes bacterium]|nr:asparagine synthase (glutamine-hydrolyzing) [Bacteroidota bacterium]HET6245242.1 asparagine synthase (glutamine-hydrolyzing) [Bacteroidia bacterium]
MCGITGVYAFQPGAEDFLSGIDSSVFTLSKRGPDSHCVYKHNKIALGHTRLSIIDTSEAGIQPFTDISGRYTIVFNGEFFNFKEHKAKLIKAGVTFKSGTDTEVLLYLYISEGVKCLNKINGFFAFAIYDKLEDSLFIARDRLGVKPLYYSVDQNRLIFASEMKAMMAYGIKKEIDQVSLFTYFQLNYIPAPHSIFKNIKKLEPGNYLIIKNNEVSFATYYSIKKEEKKPELSYENAKSELIDLLEDAVQKRLISDVPLGAFLSGGVDSSIITALASKHTPHLNTFSIGFKDEPMFDETYYAELVANKYKTNHTVFSLSNEDLYTHLFDALDYLDEPFADSSALNVFILSYLTKKHLTVALSGDGADELFAGYHKHYAEYKAMQGGLSASLVKSAAPLWELLPKSRNNIFSNKIRQLEKFSKGLNLTRKNRYWKWAGLMDEKAALFLLNIKDEQLKEFFERKNKILEHINQDGDFNEILLTDSTLVLPNDMLVKVDMMSMANSLEVRSPFLDYRVVDFAFSLPASFKINDKLKKRILQDAFRPFLPQELYARPKKGFEVPLLKWMKTGLKSLIEKELLEENFIRQQNIFNFESVKGLLKKLNSPNPGDSVANIWALLVFQYWWKKYMND